MEKNKTPELTVQQSVLVSALLLVAAIAVASVYIVRTVSKNTAAVTAMGQQQSSNSQNSPYPATQTPVISANTAGEPYVGNSNAPVTVAYWSDFQATQSKQFAESILPDVMKKYVTTGQVKIVFKDYADLGDDSLTAALYSRSIWALYPAQYSAWWNLMMNAQDKVNTGFGDEASILKLTAQLPAIDLTKVQNDIVQNQKKYLAAITADKTEATADGITGTPSFVIGGKVIIGLPQESDFMAAIDAQLKQ